jgi:hypothetical protein
LKLTHHELVSSFAFNFCLRSYNSAKRYYDMVLSTDHKAGRCCLKPSSARVESAGFQLFKLRYEAIAFNRWFQFQLAPPHSGRCWRLNMLATFTHHIVITRVLSQSPKGDSATIF